MSQKDYCIVGFELLTSLVLISDNVLVIFAKAVSNMNISYEHLKRPVWLIFVDIISSVPVSFLHPIVSGFNENVAYLLHTKSFLKLIHVLYYSFYRLHMIRHERVVLVVCHYFITIFAFYVVLHYGFSIERCVVRNENCTLTDRLFNMVNAAGVITYRLLCEETRNEIVIVMQVISSYVAYFCVVIPLAVEMVHALINEHRHEYVFEYKKQKAETILTLSHTPHTVKAKVAKFFELHWQKQDGYNDSDLKIFLESLPLSITEELVIDMNFRALKHSKLFQNLDLAFLRCIALEMEQSFVLPGEVIYHKDSNKHMMIYVVSGVVQVLSEADGDTAVLSFSAGTCLGETTLVVNYKSTVAIVCKEYCELQFLKMCKFIEVGKKFPRQMQRLRKVVMNRYTAAKKMKTLGHLLNVARGVDENTQRMKIMWLNSTLHRLMMKNEDTLMKHRCQNIYLRDEFDSDTYEMITFTATHLDLLAITERNELVSDSVFHYLDSYPPILQPNSVLLNTWDIILCILAFVTCCIIPISTFVFQNPTSWFYWLVNFSTMLYIIDVYLRITTAVKKKNEVIGSFSGICRFRLGTLSFWLDLIAAYPLEIHANAFLRTSIALYTRLYLNRCFKYARVIKVYARYTSRCKRHVTLFKYLQYILIITYLIIVLGTMFLDSICHYKFCSEAESKFEKFLLISARSVAHHLYMLGISFRPKSLSLLVDLYLICCIIAGTIILFLTAAVVNSEIVSSYFQIQIVEISYNLLEITNRVQMGRVCRRRIIDYISTQWNYDYAQKLISSIGVFAQMPTAIYSLYKENKYQRFVRDMPLFKELDDEVISELCSLAYVEVLPPKEVISYRGESVRVIYYITYGFVKLVAGSTSADTVGPGTSLSVFEAYLGMPLLNTSITLTHCKLVAFPWDSVKTILFHKNVDGAGVNYTDLKEQFSQIRKKHKGGITYDLDSRSKTSSFKNFGYNLKSDSQEEYEYYVPFDRLMHFFFVQFFLMRVTILPDGRFIFVWELLRSVFAILSAVLFTIPPIVTCWQCHWWWVLLFLDLTAVIDIYLRFHFCYYDDKGLLITHPLKTASHYLNHGFLVDLVGVFPIRFLFHPSNAYQNKLDTVLHYTRCLQLYRFYFFFYSTNSFVPRTILIIARYFCFILISVLMITSVHVNVLCSFHSDIPASINFTKGVICMANSWLDRNDFEKPLSPFHIYLISTHYISVLLANMRNLLFYSYPDPLYIFLEHVLIVGGYCLYIFLVGKFAALLTYRTDLLQYQRSLNILNTFMKKQKVARATQQQMIQHYILQWEKNRGKGIHRATEKLHKTLRADVIYNVYGHVLEISSVFNDSNREFYRELLLECKHEAFPKDFVICSVNDIMSQIYILYKGSVKVIAPDGTSLTRLGIGSMFGNLDEYPSVRQTVGFVACGNVQLLIVPTVYYYKQLKLHPKLYKSFKFLTAIHIDYLKGRFEPESEKEETVQNRKHLCKCLFMVYNTQKPYFKIWQFIQLFLVCYVLNLLQIYMTTVVETSICLFAVLYLSDLLYLFDAVFVQYHTAFMNEAGNLVTNLHQIRKRRNKDRMSLLVDLLSTLPLDIPFWFLPISSYWRHRLLLYFRLNRQLRLYNFFMHLKRKGKELSSSHTLVRSAKLASSMVLIVHVITCCYVRVDCSDKTQLRYGKEINCDAIDDANSYWLDKTKNYLKHLYTVLSFMLSSVQTYQISYGFYVVLFLCVMLMMTTVLTTYMYAEVFSIISSRLQWRSLYEGQCCHLLNFMKRRDLSEELVNKVWNYVRFLWKRQNGVTFPKFLMEAPTPLKTKILCQCYSSHITKNVIFKKCHEDFIRQLLLSLRLDTYFPGDFVVFKGDINDSMYFIHKGSVLILSEDTHRKEDVVGKLVMGQSFGVLQGLLPLTPHVYFYQAVSKTDILTLKRENWAYLLDYFPASREVIYAAAETYLGF